MINTVPNRDAPGRSSGRKLRPLRDESTRLYILTAPELPPTSAFRPHPVTMSDDHLQILIKTLRDHDLPYDREELKAAFAQPESQAAIQEWIEEFLSPETVLSKDEANL